jgi:hypothetical protein
LRHLLFGGEALRPDGLLGVVLPSFVLLTEKLANVLLGVFEDTREGRTLRIGGVGGRRSVVPAQGWRDRRSESDDIGFIRQREKDITPSGGG